jgi:hypothetical protein
MDVYYYSFSRNDFALIILALIFLTVADVEVKGDGVFIRLRKEPVSSGLKTSSDEGAKFGDGGFACVSEVMAGVEGAIFEKDVVECTALQSGDFVSLESVDNIPMEDLF